MIAGERFDVIVIGAGVVGSSVTMALAERGLKTLAVDIDLSGRLSSSEKNAGGVRATWWQRVNIALCRASIEYYQRVRDEVGFRQKGYLWLYDQETFARAVEHIPLQRELGHPIEALTRAEVNRRVPEIDKLDGIAGATFSPADGLINPNLLKGHYRARALKLGAQFLDRTYVVALDAGASSVRLQCWQSDEPHSDEGLVRMMTQDGPGEAETGHVFELNCDSIVIAGGAWSPSAMKLLGLRNWTQPIRRQVCIVDNRETNLANYGMIVDTSGVYFHNEGAHILAGYSPPDEPPGYHFNYDGEPFFLNEIWPRMFARMSSMERLRHVTGWAGLYEVSPDRSAIVGRADPTKRVYEAHSFSGRGVMQSYGAGQALADLIAHGKYCAFDASALSRDRFDRGEQVWEELHI
ncbi:MAG TPA: FAD-dependent oxidoreductase [Candidatus Binatus sp.]|uniref:NAD(P)/FAD-dependent oxidoreductase n=1 Tax=Candidatus Binatus sp. TaxID=2811406 RepID=UPI002B48465A|nr:FAD-dependent oxidoreductase [Candidatus Binatus sp.]HKN12889.1 FAD-dependent oxidoreductase [Candidatus Binatus sp.]